MLAEIVLTPDVFCCSDDCLRNRLTALQQAILPRRSTPIFAVCQLGSKQWQSAVGAKIAAIRNPELRSNAQALFERMVEEVSVFRPLSNARAPKSEREWISVAEQSSSQKALDGIVANESIPESQLLLSVEQFASDEFCDSFPNPRFVARTEQAQIRSLRTICLHTDWLILRMPQLRGGDDDEIVTLKQILKLASARLPGQAKCSVELHVCRQKEIPDAYLKKKALPQNLWAELS